jgi:hypothetical protein
LGSNSESTIRPAARSGDALLWANNTLTDENERAQAATTAAHNDIRRTTMCVSFPAHSRRQLPAKANRDWNIGSRRDPVTKSGRLLAKGLIGPQEQFFEFYASLSSYPKLAILNGLTNGRFDLNESWQTYVARPAKYRTVARRGT